MASLKAGEGDDDRKKQKEEERDHPVLPAKAKQSRPAAPPSYTIPVSLRTGTITDENLMHATLTERLQQMTREAHRASYGLLGLVLQTMVDEMRQFFPLAENSHWARAEMREEMRDHLGHLHDECFGMARYMVDGLLGSATEEEEKNTSPVQLTAILPDLVVGDTTSPDIWPPSLRAQGQRIDTIIQDVSRMVLHVIKYPDQEITAEELPRLVRHVIIGQWNECILDWAFEDDAVARESYLQRTPAYDWRGKEEMTREKINQARAVIKTNAEKQWTAQVGDTKLPTLGMDAMFARLDHGSPQPSALFAGAALNPTIECAPNIAFTSERNRNVRRLVAGVERAVVLEGYDGLDLSAVLLGVDGIRPTLLTSIAAGRVPWISGEKVEGAPLPAFVNSGGSGLDGVEARQLTQAYRAQNPATTRVNPRETPVTSAARHALQLRARHWLSLSPRLREYVALLQENAGLEDVSAEQVLENILVICGAAGPLHELEMIHGMEEAAAAAAQAPPSRWQTLMGWYRRLVPAEPTVEEGKRADREFFTAALRLHLFEDLVTTMLHQLSVMYSPIVTRAKHTTDRIDLERAHLAQQVGDAYEARKALILPAWYVEANAVIENVTRHGGYGPFDPTKTRAESPTLEMPYVNREWVEFAALGNTVRNDLYLHWLVRAVGIWRIERAEEPYKGMLGACRRVRDAFDRAGHIVYENEGEQDDIKQERLEDILALSNLQLFRASLAATVVESLGTTRIGTAAFATSLVDLFLGRAQSPLDANMMAQTTLSRDLIVQRLIKEACADPFFDRAPADFLIRAEDAAKVGPLLWLLEECVHRRAQGPAALEQLAQAASGSPLMIAWLEFTRALVEHYRLVIGVNVLDATWDYWLAARTPRRVVRDEKTGQVTNVGMLADLIGGAVTEELYSGETWPFCMLTELVARLPAAVVHNQPTLGYVMWKRMTL